MEQLNLYSFLLENIAEIEYQYSRISNAGTASRDSIVQEQ